MHGVHRDRRLHVILENEGKSAAPDSVMDDEGRQHSHAESGNGRFSDGVAIRNVDAAGDRSHNALTKRPIISLVYVRITQAREARQVLRRLRSPETFKQSRTCNARTPDGCKPARY